MHQRLWLGLTVGWVRDLVCDGDVEPNPGPSSQDARAPPGPVRNTREKARASPIAPEPVGAPGLASVNNEEQKETF